MIVVQVSLGAGKVRGCFVLFRLVWTVAATHLRCPAFAARRLLVAILPLILFVAIVCVCVCLCVCVCVVSCPRLCVPPRAIRSRFEMETTHNTWHTSLQKGTPCPGKGFHGSVCCGHAAIARPHTFWFTMRSQCPPVLRATPLGPPPPPPPGLSAERTACRFDRGARDAVLQRRGEAARSAPSQWYACLAPTHNTHNTHCGNNDHSR